MIGIGKIMILDVLLDTLIDSVKLLPFLFLTYLLMEYIEHKMRKKSQNLLKSSGKAGPVFGAVLGIMPQCGFSAAASNLYAGRVITLGTLLATYLSTSDEMLPILISEAVHYNLIIKILLIKVFIGMISGFIIDFFVIRHNHGKQDEMDVHHFCEHEHCHCGNGILKPAVHHTMQILIFIFIFSLILNYIITLLGTDILADFIMNKPFIGEILAGIIGLIPNCAASVIITQLYLDGVIKLGTMMSGLLVGAGIGLLVLFKVNDNRKENIKIISILFLIGVISGIIINGLGI